MIRRLVKINLKGTKNIVQTVSLVIVAIMITCIKLSILNLPYSKTFYMGDIIISIFGGLKSTFDFNRDFPEFVVWLIPNVLILYLINSNVIQKFKERTILILPRAQKKGAWLIACNITIWATIIKYYLVLFISSLITIFIKMGPTAFGNKNILVNSYNSLNYDINQYLLILYIFLLNILTMICLVHFINNIYYIFSNSNQASVIVMLICFITVIITKFSKMNRFFLMNQQMLIRHNLFKQGFEGFTISFSILYLCVFLLINLILSTVIINKRDINDI